MTQYKPHANAIKKIMRGVVLLSIAMSTTCWASVTFTNNANSLLMDNANARLAVSNPAKVIGFSQRSIVKAYGNNTSNAWPESYTSNAVIGDGSIAGVTLPARTNLVDANSNAICFVPVSLRTTSNLLLYTARTYSSSMWVLRSRGDSTNLLTRTTSNAVNPLYSRLTGAVPVADSIDGTQFVKYCTNHYVFHNNGNAWTARGWVRFNNGFTVMPRASVLMDTLTTVSGGFDLRDTGTLILNNDLYLAHNVTLTNGGNIKGRSSSSGQANTIFMGGDLTLASTTFARTLHITGDWSNSGTSGDLIIDGGGHTLTIGDRAQIFVDQNITLTLRNMTIRTGPKSLMVPPIRLASTGSKLALDNVMFDLGADFQFKQGQIFIHDEVAVTGTSAFIYQSPVPSYITSGATWSFEQGTTFSVAPATFTDCPCTVNNTYTNNAFVVLADASATLGLNGCSFQTTYTGLRLTKGMVFFDNRVAVDTMAGVALNTTTPVTAVSSRNTGTFPSVVKWSPNGKFLLVINYGDTTNAIQVYGFDGSSAASLLYTISRGTANDVNGASWSPDGRFFAVVNYDLPIMTVYRFNGSSTPTLVGTAVSTGTGCWDVCWSPDGKFLVEVDRSGVTAHLYRFDGVSTPVSVYTLTGLSSPVAVAWSPDGMFVVILNPGDNTMKIYRFNGRDLLSLVGTVGAGNYPYTVAWSPDGRFVAVTPISDTTFRVYRFHGSGDPELVGSPVAAGTQPNSVCWSPDGRFLAVVPRSSNTLRIYSFNGSATPELLGTPPSTGTSPICVDWSPDGKFLAVVSVAAGPGSLQIFRCNFVSTPVAQQGFSNSLLFGDKAKGVAYDADVRALGGATVKINGMVKDDSA